MDKPEQIEAVLMPCPKCDGQGGTDGYDQSGEPTHAKATCLNCNGTGEVRTPSITGADNTFCSHAGTCEQNLIDHDGAFCANEGSITGEDEELIERLLRTEKRKSYISTARTAPIIENEYDALINPDGPEAVARIQALTGGKL